MGLTFRNIDEFKKRLVKSGLVWSRRLSTLLSMNEESVSRPRPCSWANISNIFVGSFKNRLLDKLSAKTMKIWTKSVFCVVLIKQ